MQQKNLLVMKKYSKYEFFFVGIKDSIPIIISFFFIFSSLGFAYKENGFSVFYAVKSTFFIFAAPLQIFLLNKDVTNAYSIMIATFIINFRFILMSSVLYPIFKGVKKNKILISLGMMSASSFTVVFIKNKSYKFKSGHEAFYYFLGVAIPSYILAVLSTMIGYYFLFIINNNKTNIIFMFVLPLHFTALTAMKSKNKKLFISTLLGFCLTPFINITGNTIFSLLSPIIFGFIFFIICHKITYKVLK